MFHYSIKEFIHFWCLSHWLGIIIELRVNYEVINQSRNNPPQLIVSTESSFEKLERTTYHNYSRSSNNLSNQLIEKLNLLFARTQLRSSVGIATEQATASALIRITQEWDSVLTGYEPKYWPSPRWLEESSKDNSLQRNEAIARCICNVGWHLD